MFRLLPNFPGQPWAQFGECHPDLPSELPLSLCHRGNGCLIEPALICLNSPYVDFSVVSLNVSALNVSALNISAYRSVGALP